MVLIGEVHYFFQIILMTFVYFNRELKLLSANIQNRRKFLKGLIQFH